MKPKLAVWKFASCDGCQLTLLDLEDHLLAIADTVELADFREATSRYVEGPFDLSLVEGSITTPHDAERIQVSMERHMDCGVGLCGHCQLGPTLICRNGPVYSYPAIAGWMEVREL